MLVAGLKKLHPTLPCAHHIVLDSVCSCNINCCFGNCGKCYNTERFIRNLLNEDHPDDFSCDYYQWEPNKRKELIHTT
jgi:hypothetical protein